MVATVGNQMQGVAIGWELYERTSSPLALGMVGLVQVLPVILLAIPAGHAADRHSRKWLIILAHALLLLATVGLALLSRGATRRLDVPVSGGHRGWPGAEPACAMGDPSPGCAA